MRWLIAIITSLALSVSAFAVTQNSIVFDNNYAFIENSQVLNSNGAATALSFQLGGIQFSNTDDLEAGSKIPEILTGKPEKFGRINEDGYPDLPLYTESIIIPDNSGYRINILSVEYEVISEVNIAPCQPSPIEGDEGSLQYVKNDVAYSRDEFYPGEMIAAGPPSIMRDFRFIDVIVYPVQYNPVTHEMRVYTNIEYEIIYEGYDSRNVKLRTDNYISESFISLYRNHFDNAEYVLTDYTPQRGGYLIVSAYSCTTRAREFGEWKHEKGYDVQILSTSDIGYANTQVKTAIQNAYNASDPKIEFVLLIGDVGSGTSTGFRIDTFTESFQGDETDLTFALLEGDDWEPDVFVGRMSVRDMNHLNTVMAKTLTYEKNPDMSDPGYYKRGLVVAGNCCGTPNPTSPRLVNLWNRTVMLAHGYTQVDSVFWVEGSCPNYARISGAINDGVSLVTYRGYSGSDHWYYPNWGISQIGALTNGWKLGVLASIVCNTGDFGYDQCLGEAWLRTGSETYPRGGVGFYGPTEFNTATRWNNTIMIGLVSALLEYDTYRLTPVLWAGKHHARESFPRMTGQNGWRFYYQIYNVLGDPELCIRTDTPKTMSVAYNSSLNLGTNFLDIHVDADGGGVLENAYVCLVKGDGTNDEIFAGGWTDAAGNITLEFNPATAGDIHVTASYRNYIPYQGICSINSQATMVAYNDLTIDDDNSGNSNGNSDGNVNPTESVELNVLLKNFGISQTATGVSATLTSTNPSVQVTFGTLAYPNIAPGATAYPSSGQFAIHLDGDIEHDELIELPLSVTTDQGSYSSRVFIQVKSMKFSHTGTSFPGNNLLDPGETTTMTVNLENIGDLDGESLTGVLSCSDSYLTISDNTASFGTINMGESGSNGSDPFTVSASSAAYDGRNVIFGLQLTSAGGVVSTSTFSVVLGDVGTDDASGPDNYGYYMYDNTDTQYGDLAPVYDWNDLNSQPGATEIVFDNLDDASELITLPFDFVYYGQTYTEITVCINGFISVDNVPFDQEGHYWYNFDNYPIPDPGNARGQISPFWDDLRDGGGGTAGVYKWYDSVNQKFVLEWSDLTHANTSSPECFQLIIFDPAYYATLTGDAEIIFQYQTINNNDNSTYYRKPETYSSVGFENWDENDGIQYEYDNVYHPAAAVLANGRAIRITTNTGSVLSAPGLVSPPDEDITDDTTPTLTWSEVTEATGYHLQVDDNSGFSSPIVDNQSLSEESFTFSTPLSPGLYYWRVRCTDGSNWSNFTPAWSFVVSILEIPVTILPTNGSLVYEHRPEFIWHEAAGAVQYHFQIDDASNFTSPIYNNTSLTDTAFTIPFDLTSGTFFWRIRAYDGTVWSNYCSSCSFTTSAPEAPALLSPADGYSGSDDPPTFVWEAPGGGSSYDLVIDDNSDFSSPLLSYEGYQGTTITPLNPLGEGTYYWHVRAEGDFGYSGYSPSFTFTIDYGLTGYAYVPGDANMRTGQWPPTVIGGDVTYLVGYFRGLNQACLISGFYCSGDANGDCSVIGSDVTKMVTYFRGLTTLSFCPDYEPLWPTPGDTPPSAPSGWPNCEDDVAASKIVPEGSGE